MADGLNEYRGNPLGWAVDTVIEGNVHKTGLSVEELVGNVWDFIVAAFEEEGIPLPNKNALIKGVASRLT